MDTIFFNNKGIKKDKNLRISKTKNKNSLPCSEICDSEETVDKQNVDYFDGDTEILIGEDIDLKNTKVKKVFDFSKSNEPILNVNVKDEDSKRLHINSNKTIDQSLTVKRSYSLRPSTVKMLQELKVFIYDDPYIKYNDIVDAAIRFFYDYKKK